jgi:hypothetical protein
MHEQVAAHVLSSSLSCDARARMQHFNRRVLLGRLQEGRMLEAHETDDEIDRMHELFSSIFDEEYPPEDLSAAEWLKQKVDALAAHHVFHRARA